MEVRTSQKDQPEVRRAQMEIDRTNNRVCVCVCSAASLSVISCGQQVEGCVSDKQQVCPPGGQQLELLSRLFSSVLCLINTS